MRLLHGRTLKACPSNARVQRQAKVSRCRGGFSREEAQAKSKAPFVTTSFPGGIGVCPFLFSFFRREAPSDRGDVAHTCAHLE